MHDNKTQFEERQLNIDSSIPVMPVQQFITWINPQIAKAVFNNQKRRKKRNEILLFVMSYLLFIFIAGAAYLDYRVNGLSNSVPAFLGAAGILSIGLILYIPVMIKLGKKI